MVFLDKKYYFFYYQPVIAFLEMRKIKQTKSHQCYDFLTKHQWQPGFKFYIYWQFNLPEFFIY